MTKETLRGRLLWGALAIYWVALFVVTHLPPPQALPLPDVSDKLVHSVAYGGLTLLLWLAWSRRHPWHLAQPFRILALLAAYAAGDELLQIPFGRYGDCWDWIADIIGVAVVLALCSTWSFFQRDRAARSLGKEESR